jgi:hypothetical protein
VTRAWGGILSVFTRSDGLPVDRVNGLVVSGRRVWVATPAGTGWFDGTWSFPTRPPLTLAASALAADPGHVFLATASGLYCVGACSATPVDARHGLLDDAVLDVTEDGAGRLWVRTEHAISLVKP